MPKILWSMYDADDADDANDDADDKNYTVAKNIIASMLQKMQVV